MSFYYSVGVGAIWFLTLWLVFKLLKGLWTCWIADLLGFSVKWRGGPSTYAVVTGSTDGIGLEYAKEMARRGYSLVLISRSAEKLAKTKEDIKAKFPKCSDIRTITADFSNLSIYDNIEKTLSEIDDIDVLVNNVGISYPYPEYFTQIEDADRLIESIININVVSCTRMIQAVMPKMAAKKRGVIINVSSTSACYPAPLLALYASSKIYVDFLSRALQVEYAEKGIVVQSVLPAYVSTKMSKIRKASLLVPTPSTYVRSALKTVGVEARTYGFWSHKLQYFVLDCIIGNILGTDYNTKIVYNSLKDVRRRYYKKHDIKEKKN